jgi:GT2 family glycosyltransferase
MWPLFSPTASRAGVVAEPPAVVISTLFFYKEEISERFLRAILKQVNQFAASGRARVHFVASLNYEHPEFAARVRHLAKTLIDDSHVRFTCVENHYNKGFGKAHNEAFAAFPSDIFITLNNDLFIRDDRWLLRIIEAFDSPTTAIVGAQESASCLNEVGYGIPVGDHGREIDFLEGSLLAVRSTLVKQLGLFAPDLDFVYFEDSDLCLRYRAAGHALTPISIPHEHLRYSSTSLVPRGLLEGILNSNRARFFSRWKRYMDTRRFTRRIQVSAVGVEERVLLASLPALLALKKQHPRATMQVVAPATRWNELFRQRGMSVCCDGSPAAEFDQTHDLTAAPLGQPLPIGQTIAAYLGVSFLPHLALEFLQLFAQSDESSGAYALIDVGCFRQGFEGICPSAEDLAAIIEMLERRGLSSVLSTNGQPGEEYGALQKKCSRYLGPETSAKELLTTLAGASLLVGGDGPLLQLAQLLEKRSFTIFGPTLPTRTIHHWSTNGFFVRQELDCLGCHVRWSGPQSNYCLRRDQACMHNAGGPALLRELANFLDGQPACLPVALALEQRVQMKAVEQMVRCAKVQLTE